MKNILKTKAITMQFGGVTAVNALAIEINENENKCKISFTFLIHKQ